MSAHRTPDRVREFVSSARDRGFEVIIAAAGGAAALPGVCKAYTPLPVIGVPLASSELKGIDALYSIVQMPPGMPVATVAIGAWGARNAATLAAEILALSHDDIRAGLRRLPRLAGRRIDCRRETRHRTTRPRRSPRRGAACYARIPRSRADIDAAVAA